jgi:hypothetical protein
LKCPNGAAEASSLSRIPRAHPTPGQLKHRRRHSRQPPVVGRAHKPKTSLV